MKLWKKLQNPYALVAQGFVFGGLLFFATHSESIAAPPIADSIAALTEAAR